MLVPVTLFRISDDVNQDWIGGTLYEALAKLCSEYNWRWHRVKEVGKHYITLEIMETWNTLEDVCNLWEDDAYDVAYYWDSIIAHVAEVPAAAALQFAQQSGNEPVAHHPV